MKKKALLAAAVSAAIPGAADAATYTLALTEVREYFFTGTQGLTRNITSSTATWSYDDATNLVSQTGGVYEVSTRGPENTVIFRHSITGLLIGTGGAASAATFVCTEGTFGARVGASLCGNYNFGANFFNESTATWGPGTAVSRTLGGDDRTSGNTNGDPQVSIAMLDGMNTITWTGTTLVLANKTCTGVCTTNAVGWNAGEQWTFAVVPVPPAVWLFGSALGVMGWMRRKRTG